MFKPIYSRKIPAGAERRVSPKGVEQVKYKGKWLPLNGRGKVAVPSTHYHARVGGKVVRLTTEKLTSEIMLADMRRKAERVALGIELPEDHTSEDFKKLLKRFLGEKEELQRNEWYIWTVEHRIKQAANYFGWKTIPDIRKTTPALAGQWAASLKGKPTTKLGVITSTVQFLKWLYRQRLISEVIYIPKPSNQVEVKRRALTREEVERLIKVSPWPRNLVYDLTVTTLARRGAVRALVASDFNLDDPQAATMRLRAQTAKTGEEQLIPIQPRLVPLLKKRIKEVGDRPLFGDFDSKPWDRTFRKDREKAQIQEITDEGFATYHSLRHTGATWMAQAGLDLLLIMKMGGWKTLDMLAKTYSHMTAVDRRGAINMVFSPKEEKKDH